MLNKYASSFKMGRIVLFVLLLFLAGQTVSFAYDSWEAGSGETAMENLNKAVEKLALIVEKGKQARAAHPDFQQDLENAVLELQVHLARINDLGLGQPGQGSYSSVSITVSTKTPSRITGPELRFLGFLEDKVGSWSLAVPDGSSDATLQMRMFFPNRVEIRNIQLYRSDVDGNKGKRWWHSHSGDSWILGIFEEGRMLNADRPQSLGIFQGWVLFDLYGADQPPCFEKGEYLLLIVTTNEGDFQTLYRVGSLEEKFALP